MNTDTPSDPISSAPITEPGEAPTINPQPTAVDPPPAKPAAGATALNPPQPTTPTPPSADTAPRPGGQNWARRLRPQQPLVGFSKSEPCVTKPVCEHDLLVEGSLKVTGRNGVVVEVPIHTTLSAALTPAFLPLAQQQFETVVEQLLLTPAKVAFIAYIESVKAARGIAGRKSPLL